MAFALPLAFSFALRMDSSIDLRSSPAFFARSSDLCRRSWSSEWSASSSSIGGTASDWFLKSDERTGEGSVYGCSLDDMASVRRGTSRAATAATACGGSGTEGEGDDRRDEDDVVLVVLCVPCIMSVNAFVADYVSLSFSHTATTMTVEHIELGQYDDGDDGDDTNALLGAEGRARGIERSGWSIVLEVGHGALDGHL